MIKVLDLFAGTQSVRKALTEKLGIDDGKTGSELGYSHQNGYGIGELQYGFNKSGKCVAQYLGIDITSPEQPNLIFDLSQDNVVANLKSKLGEGTPNFEGASPICNKLSGAVTGPNGNAYFVIENNNLRLRKLNEYSVVKHNGINKRPELGSKYIEDAKLALKLHENTLKIVKSFNVPFAIENPYNSLAKYIYKEFFRNKADYCGYGFEYKKPTAIYTGRSLNLAKHNKTDNHRCLRFDRINQTTNGPSHGNKNVSTYANRSSVPPKLIIEVMDEVSGRQSGLHE